MTKGDAINKQLNNLDLQIIMNCENMFSCSLIVVCFNRNSREF